MADKSLQEFLDTTLLKTPQNYIQNLLKTVHSKNITMEDWNTFVKQLDALIRKDNEIYNGFKATLVDLQTFDYGFAQTIESARAEFEQAQDNAVAEFTELKNTFVDEYYAFKNDADAYLERLKDIVLEHAPVEIQGTKAFIITSYDSATGKAYIEQTDETTAQLTELQTILASEAKDISYLFEFENPINVYGQTIFNYDFYTTITGVDIENGALIVEAMPAEIANSGVHYCYIIGYPQFGTESIGEYASARGCENSAQGFASQANGYNTVAAGKYSFTSGRDTQAAYAARAGGSGSKAKGKYAIAEGYNCETGTKDCSVAIGMENKALAQSSVALGQFNEASGHAAFAVNNDNKAEGSHSAAFGTGNTASGAGAIVFGSGCAAKGVNSIAGGSDSVTDEGASLQIAFGQNSKAKTYGSVAIGNYCQSNSTWSLAFGTRARTEGIASVSMGADTKAFHRCSSAHGNNTETSAENQFVVGKNNKANSEALFQVGNGVDANNRSNAFEVLKDGTLLTPFGTPAYMYAGNVSGVNEHNLTTIFFDIVPTLLYWNRSGNYVFDIVGIESNMAVDDHSITFRNDDNREISYYAFSNHKTHSKSFFLISKATNGTSEKIPQNNYLVSESTTWGDIATMSATSDTNIVVTISTYWLGPKGICRKSIVDANSRWFAYIKDSKGNYVSPNDYIKNEIYYVDGNDVFRPQS